MFQVPVAALRCDPDGYVRVRPSGDVSVGARLFGTMRLGSGMIPNAIEKIVYAAIERRILERSAQKRFQHPVGLVVRQYEDTDGRNAIRFVSGTFGNGQIGVAQRALNAPKRAVCGSLGVPNDADAFHDLIELIRVGEIR